MSAASVENGILWNMGDLNEQCRAKGYIRGSAKRLQLED